MIKDVQEYMLAMANRYAESEKLLEKVNKEIEEGLVSPEQRANFEQYFSTIRANYERIAYINYLLFLPPKFIRKLKEKKLMREQEKFAKQMADRESVEKETDEAINNIKESLPDKGEEECEN